MVFPFVFQANRNRTGPLSRGRGSDLDFILSRTLTPSARAQIEEMRKIQILPDPVSSNPCLTRG